MIELNLENCCRTCLQEKEFNEMKLLSTKSQSQDILSYSDMLLTIIKESLLPYDNKLKICLNCEINLTNAYNFIVLCQNTEKILSDQYTQSQTQWPTTKKIVEIEEVKIETYKEDESDTEQNVFDNCCKDSMDLHDNDESIIVEPKLSKKRGRKSKPSDNKAKQKPSIKNPNTIESVKSPPKPKTKKPRKATKNENDAVIDKVKIKKKRIYKNRIQSKYCQKCDIHFDHSKEYMKHYRQLHWATYPCTLCGKMVNKCFMADHISTHTKEKNHVCSLCGDSFSFANYLHSHMRKHSTEKRYKCDYCDKRFKYWNTKRQHINLTHEPTNAKKYECYLCHRQFVQRGGMIRHLVVHTGELPFSCQVCSKRFSLKQNLKRHMKTTHKENSIEEKDLLQI